MKLAKKTARFVPYQPIQGQYRVRLDANESFLLPTESDREKMAAAAGAAALNRYPDPTAGRVCRAFAARAAGRTVQLRVHDGERLADRPRRVKIGQCFQSVPFLSHIQPFTHPLKKGPCRHRGGGGRTG